MFTFFNLYLYLKLWFITLSSFSMFNRAFRFIYNNKKSCHINMQNVICKKISARLREKKKKKKKKKP